MAGGRGDRATTVRHPFYYHEQCSIFALVVILSISGLVCLEDAAFAAFSLAYVLFLHKYAFPPKSPCFEPHVLNREGVLEIYMSTAAAIGLLAPAAYVLEATYGSGGSVAVNAAARHLFLLSCQVLAEWITFFWGLSLPAQAVIPVLYNSRRLFSVADWLRHELRRDAVASWRTQAGIGLAAANTAFWYFNLFGYLLPVYLPKVFRRYHGVSETKPR